MFSKSLELLNRKNKILSQVGNRKEETGEDAELRGKHLSEHRCAHLFQLLRNILLTKRAISPFLPSVLQNFFPD